MSRKPKLLIFEPMNPSNIHIALIAILCFGFLLERVLEFLNLKQMKPALPEALADFYDQEKYSRSQAYQKEKARFGLLASILSFVSMLAMLLFGGFGYLDTFLRGYIDNSGLLALAFFGILGFASDLIGIPFSLYGTFVIEEKYGFNKMTIKLWIWDKIKGWLLAAVLGSLVVLALIWVIDTVGPNFWIWFWAGTAAFTLGIQYLYTSVLLPIFNKLVPLEDGELRQEIEAYSKEVDFPLDNIMIMDGSKRSTKANAFFAGFGKRKRIVLFDTLVAQMSNQEIMAVLAHEVGHYKKKHIVLGTVLSILNIGLTLFILSLLVKEPALSFALGAKQAGIHLALVSFAMLYSPLSQITGLGMNLLSRKNEYEADAYAKTTYDGEALGSSLIKLHTETLSNLDPHPAYVFMHYSHPTLVQRLNALRK